MAPKSLSIVLGVAALASSAAADYQGFLFPRNNPPQPPCVYPYTKFVYSGCFYDSVSSRSLPFVAALEFNNATVEQCTAYCKGNNYRYAGLEYYGQCYCGASVSSGAAPEADCNLPCNGDKSQACGGQDRLSIYQDPTFPDADDIAVSSDYKSLGCYTEGSAGRSLDYSQWDFLNISAMTTETCLTACGAKGYPFAGTEFGRECYCGVVLGNGTTAADASSCSTPCTGNSSEICGGPDHLSLYVAKNLESTEPCAPPVLSSSSSSSSTAKSTSTSSSTSKCVGWYCPPPTTPCKTHSTTPTPTPSSTKKSSSTSTPKSTSSTKCTTSSSTQKTSSTLKTTTTCKTSSTPKVTSTKKSGW